MFFRGEVHPFRFEELGHQLLFQSDSFFLPSSPFPTSTKENFHPLLNPFCDKRFKNERILFSSCAELDDCCRIVKRTIESERRWCSMYSSNPVLELAQSPIFPYFLTFISNCDRLRFESSFERKLVKEGKR